MLKVTIEIEAKTLSGIEHSINEAKKRILNEARFGFDSNEDEEFNFTVTGKEEEQD